MKAYFDTSALLKLLILEPGSSTAEEAWRGSRSVAAASVLYTEARAALAAAHRGGRFAEPSYELAKQGLARLWADMYVVVADLGLCVRAGDLAERHGLRGHDAVHLAAALEYGADALVCADGDLVDAALGCQLAVVDARA